MDIVQGFLDRTEAWRFLAGKKIAVELSIRRETFEIVCFRSGDGVRGLEAGVSLHDIRELRRGKRSKDFQGGADGSTFADSQCLVLLHGDEFQLQTLSLALASEADAVKWVDGVGFFRSSPLAASYPFRLSVWIFRTFEWMREAGDSAVTPKEMRLYYATKLGRKIDRKELLQARGTVGGADSGLDLSTLSFEENSISWEKFHTVTKNFLHNQQIFTDCFGRYTTGRLSRRDLLEFLKIEQGEAEEDALPTSVAKEYFVGNPFEQGFVPADRAVDFLFSPSNTIWDESASSQDMSRPLSAYWIASSHNTYLTGDQLSSASSVEAYVRVLRLGCRCIELDCFDGPKGLPVIYHGFTLTSKIPFVEVLEAVRDHAFATSEFPLILSIENHCGLKQQRVMAEKFREIFGAMLVTEPLSPDETLLPSPEQLKRRIILKGRKLSSGGSATLSGSMKAPGISAEGATEDSDMGNMRKTGRMYLQNSVTHVWEPFFFALTDNKLLYTELESKTAPTDGPDPSVPASNYSSMGPPRGVAGQSPEQIVTNVKANLKQLHFKKRWFHGDITTKEEAAARTSAFALDGGFLVRRSATGSGFAICFFSQGSCYHMRIEVKHRQGPGQEQEALYFLVEGGPCFPSVYQLVTYYRKHALDTREFKLLPFTRPVPQPAPREPWFYADLDREGAEKVLRALPLPGAFLVRYSSEGGLVVSFRAEGGVKHCRVVEDGRLLTIGLDSFESISELVRFYREHPFYKGITLQRPVTSELLRLSEQSEGEGPELAEFTPQQPQETDSPFGGLQRGGSVDLSEVVVQKNSGPGGKLCPYTLSGLGGLTIGVGSQAEAKEWQEAVGEMLKQKPSAVTSSKKQAKIAPELSELIVYAASVKSLPSLESIRAKGRAVCAREMSSFSETVGEKCMGPLEASFVWLHQVALCRIYPKGQRVDSSNYNPIRFWNYGCQMVALNYQTPDKAMQLNHGRFRTNRRCGYVLKPSWMLGEGGEGSEEQQRALPPVRLELCVIAGRHVLCGKPGLKGFVSPFVEVEVHGACADNTPPGKHCTKVDKANGLNPFWNHKFSIDVQKPELALLRFVVQYHDTFGDPNFIAQATYPVPHLREGYRSIQLTNGYSEETMGALLVHLRREEIKNGLGN